MITNVLIFFATFITMEGVAWFTHKYIMHGLLWYFHEDHHVPNKNSKLEKNDFFFLIFSIPGMFFTIFGIQNNLNWMLAIGLGITFYGFIYFLIHEIFIHQRIKWFRNTNNKYLKALRRAHKIHHKHLTKEDGECFGMLIVPFKYFKNK